MHWRAFLFSLLVVLCFAVPAEAWDRRGAPVLDAVDIQRVDRELYAMRDAAPTVSTRLERQEEVIWVGAQGHVGVVLTTRRVLGVTRNHSWREYRMRAEDGQAIAQLGGRLALVITMRRVLWLDSRSGDLREQRLGAGEYLVTSGVRDDVAVAVTNRRGMGFSGGRSFSTDTPLRARERFYGLRVFGTAGTIETSRRFLVFSSTTGAWMDQRRAIR